MHNDPQAGHPGCHKTYQRAKKDFIWVGMKKDIKAFVKECSVCQENKFENVPLVGLFSHSQFHIKRGRTFLLIL